MSLYHKRDHFEMDDLLAFGAFCGLKPKRAREVVQKLQEQVENWMAFADEDGVPEAQAAPIYRAMWREIAKA